MGLLENLSEQAGLELVSEEWVRIKQGEDKAGQAEKGNLSMAGFMRR